MTLHLPQKSTWKNFLEHKEYCYLGSWFNKTSQLTDYFMNAPHLDFIKNREFLGGTKSLRFKNHKGETTHLDKRGKVIRIKDVYLINSSYKDEFTGEVTENTVAYMVQTPENTPFTVGSKLI